MSDQIDIDINVNMNNTDEVDELANKLQEATSSADDLSNSLSDTNTQGINDAANEANNLANETSNADNEVQNLDNDLGLINGAALLSVAGELSQLGQQAEGMSQNMNTAAISVGQLATNTGIAEPQIVSMINHISNETFPQDEAIAYANALNQMGVSADKLGDSATNMDKINDATGIGSDKVIKLTQGLQSMGIEADNIPSAFNAIAFAQSNVTGGTDTLQRTLMRQAGTINEYGLNIDQVVLIMQKLSEQGISTTKMGTELSSVLKDNNGDLSAVEQQLGLTSGSLQNASQVTGEYEGKIQELANQEMEHKSGLERLSAGWEDITLSASGVLSPLGSVMGMIGQTGSFAVGINGMLQLATSLTKVRDMINAVRSAESIATGIKTALAIATGAESVAEGGAAAAKSAAIAPTTGLAIAENSLLWPLLLIVGAVVAVIAVMWYLYNTNETVRNGINWLVAQIQAFITGLQPIVSAIINFVTRGISNINRLPSAIANVFNLVISTVVSWASGFVQRGIRAATNFVNSVASAISGIGGRIQSALSGVYNFITAPFKQAYDFINNNVIKPLTSAWDFITGGFGNFEGYGDFEEYIGGMDTLNNAIFNNANNSSVYNDYTTIEVKGIVEESAADYIINTVNDRLRREKLLRGG